MHSIVETGAVAPRGRWRRPGLFVTGARLSACVLLASAIAVCVPVPAAAQAGSDTRAELWPEVQFLIRTSPKTRIFLTGNSSRSAGSRETLEGQVGAHFDYVPNAHVWFRTGYLYGKSFDESSDVLEHRVVVEQTFRVMLPGAISVSDRNREEFRSVNGDYSFRYRNRVNVERDFTRRGYRFTPYAQAEVYLDSRSRSWSRNVYTAGVVLPLSKPPDALGDPRRSIRDHLSLDVYFTRQNNKESEPRHINALGVSVLFAF